MLPSRAMAVPTFSNGDEGCGHAQRWVLCIMRTCLNRSWQELWCHKKFCIFKVLADMFTCAIVLPCPVPQGLRLDSVLQRSLREGVGASCASPRSATNLKTGQTSPLPEPQSALTYNKGVRLDILGPSAPEAVILWVTLKRIPDKITARLCLWCLPLEYYGVMVCLFWLKASGTGSH